MRIACIGGGNASLAFMDIFSGDEEVQVVGVVDPKPDAPGRQRARQEGLCTAGSLEELIRMTPVDIVLELTGVPKVRQIAWDQGGAEKEFMSAGAAKTMYDLLSRREKTRNIQTAEELGEVLKLIASAVDKVDGTSDAIAGILREMRMLAINSGIEAARLGQAGAGFGVLSQRMSELVTHIQTAVNTIQESSEDSHSLLETCKDMQARLRGEQTKRKEHWKAAKQNDFVHAEHRGGDPGGEFNRS